MRPHAKRDTVLHLVGNGDSSLLDKQAKQLGGAQAERIARHEAQLRPLAIARLASPVPCGSLG